MFGHKLLWIADVAVGCRNMKCGGNVGTLIQPIITMNR